MIIGAFYGTGAARGGKLAEFLLALADCPEDRDPTKEPDTFVSFCRWGGGPGRQQVLQLGWWGGGPEGSRCCSWAGGGGAWRGGD